MGKKSAAITNAQVQTTLSASLACHQPPTRYSLTGFHSILLSNCECERERERERERGCD